MVSAGPLCTWTLPDGARYSKSAADPIRAAASAGAISRTSAAICASLSGSLVRGRVEPFRTSTAGFPTAS